MKSSKSLPALNQKYRGKPKKYADGGRVRRPAAAPVASPFDADYIERLAAQAVGAGEPVTELRSAEGRGFAPMPRDATEALQRMAAVVRGDVEPTPEEERQISHVRGFTEGPASIRAYHGSPHRFERFDISKIGTGEGNQTYGHGLYFAQHPDVAKNYRDSLTGARFGTPFVSQDVRAWLNDAGGDFAKASNDARAFLRKHGDQMDREEINSLEEAIKLLDARRQSWGHMYEVQLRTTPQELVNWNAPLVQQPERAIPFLEDILKAPRTGSARVLEREMKPIGDAVNLRTPEVAAQLRKEGVPGLQYLDADSYVGGGGPITRNYVMFGDDLIDITRRYAKGGLAALDEKYAEGGTVRAPKETIIAGQDHRLAYITPEEAALLKARGGSGRMTDYGVRAYNEGPGGEGPGGQGPGGDPSDNANSMSEAATQDAVGGNQGQGAGPTGAGAGSGPPGGPNSNSNEDAGTETSVTAPTTAPTTGAFGQFGAATGLGVVGGLAGFGIGVPGLGTIGSAIGAALDAARANEQLGMMGLNQTVDRDTAALNAATMGAFGQSVANQFGQALGFDALAEAPMSAFSTPNPLGDIAASQMDSGGSQYVQTEYGTPGLSNIATSMAPATAASLVDWNQIQREASAMNMSVSDYLAMKWRSPAAMARGGMASLEQMHAKYAEGGPVVSVYDPDEINDLANQILEGAYV